MQPGPAQRTARQLCSRCPPEHALDALGVCLVPQPCVEVHHCRLAGGGRGASKWPRNRRANWLHRVRQRQSVMDGQAGMARALCAQTQPLLLALRVGEERDVCDVSAQQRARHALHQRLAQALRRAGQQWRQQCIQQVRGVARTTTACAKPRLQVKPAAMHASLPHHSSRAAAAQRPAHNNWHSPPAPGTLGPPAHPRLWR